MPKISNEYIKYVKINKRLWKIANLWFTIHTIYDRMTLTVELERECQEVFLSALFIVIRALYSIRQPVKKEEKL